MRRLPFLAALGVVLGPVSLAGVAFAAPATVTFASPARIVGSPPLVNDGAVHVLPDFDDDGIEDQLLVQSGTVRVIETDGTSTTAPLGGALTSASEVSFADFDGDGHADLAVKGKLFTTGPDSLVAYRGLGPDAGGAPSFGPPVEVGTRARVTFRINDIDGDGHDDVVWWDPLTGPPSSSLGDAAALLQPGGTLPISQVSTSGLGLASADFNQDRIRDLAVLSDARTAILLGNGDSTFTLGPRPLVFGAPTLGDVDGDGLIDVGDGSGLWARNLGSSAPVVPEAPVAATLLASAGGLLALAVFWTRRRTSGRQTEAQTA